MFSVIDIETTGSHARYHGITEVAIINFDGDQITGKFSSLIKSDSEIPSFITHLTGISKEMTDDAPAWESVMEQIDAFTRDRILVAHNAHFDYSFLKSAFLLAGKSFQRKTLCTLRLSRQIFPGLPSYSLDRICNHLELSVQPGHRAFSDALAALELFRYLRKHDGSHRIEAMMKKRGQEFRLPPHLEGEVIPSLPASPGVYYFMDHRGKVLYVGKAKSIRARVIQHFTSNSATRWRTRLMNGIHQIQFEECGSELVALLRESAEIKKHFPPFNAAQKIADQNFGLYCYEDGKGYLRLTWKKLQKFDQPLLAFTSIQEARAFVQDKVHEFHLCARLSGMQQSRGACFDYGTGKCDGACLGKVSVRKYNGRMKKALKAMKDDSLTCAIIMNGRKEEERSVIVLEHGKYAGFGFMPAGRKLPSFKELKEVIEPQRDNRETQMIIRSYLQTHNDFQLVFKGRRNRQQVLS